MIESKKLNSKKEKKKFEKNSSFGGIGTNRSPESRRKSIATVLPTPLKKKKKAKHLNEWTVTDTSTIKRKQLVVTDNSEEFVDVVDTSTLLEIPKKKKKKSKRETIVDEIGKPICQIIRPPTKVPKVVLNEKKKIGKEYVEEELNTKDEENKFGIQANEVAKAVKGAIKLHKEHPKAQNQLFDERIPLFLQVNCHNVPKGPSRIIRIPLPNSHLTPDDEICLIVPEVKGIKNAEHEKHVEHYEDLLRRQGVDNIKKIMTFHEFRTEYETFEQKSRLVDLYDVFLVDGRISGKVVHKCGKIFYKKRKVPTSVKLRASKLKEQINNALSKTFFLLHLKGDSYNVQFGHDKMETQDLVDNVFAIIDRLDKEFPGGFNNLKGIHISALRSTSIPIYSSFKNPQEVKTPTVKPKKPKAHKTYKDELTTLLNADVVVEPSGRVLVKRKLEEDDEKENKDTITEGEKITNKSEDKGKKMKKRKQSDVNQETLEVVKRTDAKETKIKKSKKKKHGEVISAKSLDLKPQEAIVDKVENNNDIKKKKKIKNKSQVQSEENMEKHIKKKKQKTKNLSTSVSNL